MTALLPLVPLLMALGEGLLALTLCVGVWFLALALILLPGAAFEWLAGWWARAGEWQQRIAIARAEVHVRHLEGQLHRAKTHLAALKSAQL